MAVDYSIKGKGNDRKTVQVINEYEYNSKGVIIRHPWDSDVEYLYKYTLKFRGTLDLTREGPSHGAVQMGDVYYNNGNGAVATGVGWTGIEGLGIEKGWSVMYTDSDIWVFFGGAGGGKDSDTVTSVPSIAWIESTDRTAVAYRRHQNQRKLQSTSVTKMLFKQDDSDNTWLVYGEAPTRGSAVFDAEVFSQNDLWISTSKGGPKSSAKVSVFREWDEFGIRVDSEVPIVSVLGNANGTNLSGGAIDAINGDSEILVTLIDSEIDAFGILLGQPLQVGVSYLLKYEDLETNEISYLISPDGTYFRRYFPWEAHERDHDSDLRDLRRDFVTSTSNGYPVGSIIPFAHGDLPAGFRVCDGSAYDTFQFPELFQKLGTNRLPDLRNQFLRGWNNDSDGFGNQRFILSKQNDEVGPHTHTVLRTTFQDGGNAWNLGGDNDGNQANVESGVNTGVETRPTNVMVMYAIAMYNGAGLIYDSEIVYNVMMEHFIGRLDSEDARLDSEIIMLRHDAKAWDSDYDSENHRMHDSDRHDWKAADSDLLNLTGRTFVQSTTPNGVSPDLRNGDTWIDTTDNKLYYYDQTLLVWIQVRGNV